MDEVKTEILEILRLPSTVSRIENTAQKQMSFFCKRFNVCYTEKLPKAESGKRKYVERLLELEARAIDEDINYGFVPVIYRESR